MAVLGFDDDVWFGLQNAQQNALRGFAQNNTINVGFNNNNNNNNINQVFFNNDYDQAFLSSSSSSSRYEAFSQPNLDAQLELQRQEIEYILHFQNEKLRMALQEQLKQQLSSLMTSLESKASSLIQQKNDDLARATRKGMELQERLRRVETESQAWQRIARAKEASIVELNNALQRALSIGNDNTAGKNDNGAEDAESTCFGSSEEGLVHGKWVCRACKNRSSCVVFLPCKHLCSCKLCESLLGYCPVCESVKETSFEVFLV